nr:MAG TPA: hypothetical protein [Caudoviricetes sp.]
MWDAYYFDHGIAKLKPWYDGALIYDSKISATVQ